MKATPSDGENVPGRPCFFFFFWLRCVFLFFAGRHWVKLRGRRSFWLSSGVLLTLFPLLRFFFFFFPQDRTLLRAELMCVFFLPYVIVFRADSPSVASFLNFYLMSRGERSLKFFSSPHYLPFLPPPLSSRALCSLIGLR